LVHARPICARPVIVIPGDALVALLLTREVLPIIPAHDDDDEVGLAQLDLTLAFGEPVEEIRTREPRGALALAMRLDARMRGEPALEQRSEAGRCEAVAQDQDRT